MRECLCSGRITERYVFPPAYCNLWAAGVSSKPQLIKDLQLLNKPITSLIRNNNCSRVHEHLATAVKWLPNVQLFLFLPLTFNKILDTVLTPEQDEPLVSLDSRRVEASFHIVGENIPLFLNVEHEWS